MIFIPTCTVSTQKCDCNYLKKSFEIQINVILEEFTRFSIGRQFLLKRETCTLLRSRESEWDGFSFFGMFCSRNSTGLIYFTHSSPRFWDFYLIFVASFTNVGLYQKLTSRLVGCRVTRWSDNTSKHGSPPPTNRKMAMVSASSAQLTTYYRRVKLIRKRIDDFRALTKLIVCTEKRTTQT